MPLDHLSLCTTRAVLRQDEQQLGTGTAFIYEVSTGPPASDKVLCLVTAYHMLTTHEPGDGQPNQGNFIDFWIHLSPDRPAMQKVCTLPLYTKGGQPVWLQSRTCEQADIAMLPIPIRFFEGVHDLKCLSASWIESKLKLSVASTVVVIGYPYAFRDVLNGLPVWKTGTIASEPYVDFMGQPVFLVDVAGFRGMSGAPVVALATGSWESEDRPGTLNLGSTRRLLGVYTAMLEKEIEMPLEPVSQSCVPGVRYTESLQLAHVWKASLIQEIVSAFDPARYAAEILSRV
jgi:hypothetical protein